MTWPLFPFLLPMWLQGWVLGVLSLTFGIGFIPRVERGVLQLTWRPWVAKRWRYSTTLGACMWIHPEHGDRIIWHEFVHVRQYEDLCLLGAAIGGLLCIVDWRLGLIVWATSGPLWLLGNFLSGWIRFGDAYRGSEHELSAYAQTDVHIRQYNEEPGFVERG